MNRSLCLQACRGRGKGVLWPRHVLMAAAFHGGISSMKVVSLDTRSNQLSKQLATDLDASTAHMQEMQAKMAELGTLLFNSLLDEVQTGKISAYNGACAYANLVNSACKLQRL